MSEKEKYLKNLEKYHHDLAKTLKNEYNIAATYTEAMAWGYTSTIFYIKTKDIDYITKISAADEEKIRGLEKDIYLSKTLKTIIPTSKHIKNINGLYLTTFKKSTMCVAHHIRGMPPFDMNEIIFKEAMQKLRLIHQFPTDDLDPYVSGKGVFLHGDYTPSNILVSYDKIVGILDFEMAHLGKKEWDIAKAVVFFWFRWPNTSFEKALKTALEGYRDNSLDTKKITSLAKTHTHTHLKNIVAHKEHYEDQKTWDGECDFVLERLKIIEELI